MDFKDEIRKLVGKRYRVERGEDGFYQVRLNGKRGHIYQHGPETLAAHITGPRKPMLAFRAIKAKCPAAKLHVVGGDELIVLHPMEGWQRFFSACRAKARPALSEEERQRRVLHGRQLQIYRNRGRGERAKTSPNGAEAV